jgi:hypothetical protein
VFCLRVAALLLVPGTERGKEERRGDKDGGGRKGRTRTRWDRVLRGMKGAGAALFFSSLLGTKGVRNSRESAPPPSTASVTVVRLSARPAGRNLQSYSFATRQARRTRVNGKSSCHRREVEEQAIKQKHIFTSPRALSTLTRRFYIVLHCIVLYCSSF